MKIQRLLAYLALSLTLLLLGCGGGSSSNDGRELSTNSCPLLGLNSRVINGTECGQSNSPVVELEIFDATGNLSICSGTMLTSDDVLLAAHCILPEIIGARVTAGNEVFSVETFGVHPGFRDEPAIPALLNDVAIFKIRGNANVPTVPIIASRSIESGDIFSIFGFGENEDQIFGILRSGEMRTSRVTENHVIARFDGEGSNSCSGDSGGPALFSFQNEAGNTTTGIVGVVSSGFLVECGEGDTSLFTNVQSQTNLDFILRLVPDARLI